jgi:CheY-like chemotaxis protein
MPQSGSSSADAESSKRDQSSVLVVDDDVDAREMFALVLTMAGHSVRTANDGEEALVVAEAFRPDVIFMDIEMLKGNGYLACQNLRKSPALQNARIYAVSAVTGAAHERRCAEAGFDGQISKPADPGCFDRLVRRDGASISRTNSPI